MTVRTIDYLFIGGERAAPSTEKTLTVISPWDEQPVRFGFTTNVDAGIELADRIQGGTFGVNRRGAGPGTLARAGAGGGGRRHCAVRHRRGHLNDLASKSDLDETAAQVRALGRRVLSVVAGMRDTEQVNQGNTMDIQYGMLTPQRGLTVCVELSW